MPQLLLQVLRDTLDLAGEDLEAGEVARVRHHLATIRLLVDQLGGTEVREVKTPTKSAGGRPKSKEGRKIEDAITSMLTEAGRPMHMQELIEGLRKKRIPLPGQGKAANMIAHMRRMDNVQRVGHGVYELKD